MLSLAREDLKRQLKGCFELNLNEFYSLDYSLNCTSLGTITITNYKYHNEKTKTMGKENILDTFGDLNPKLSFGLVYFP